MGFNEQNFADRINRIERSYQEISDTRNFLDDNTSILRKAVTSVSMDFTKLRESIKKSEETLLISCYTVAEQMLKEAKYEILDFDTTSNTNLQTFLNSKLDPARFSPNAKIEYLEKTLGNYTMGGQEFKLLYRKNSEYLIIYDEMIQSRHTYAHKGEYNFMREKYPDVIETLKYLYFEYSEFLFNKNNFKIKIEEILLQIEKFTDIKNNQHFLAKQDDFSKLCVSIKDFLSSYADSMTSSKPLEQVKVSLENILQYSNNYNKISSICKDILEKTGR